MQLLKLRYIVPAALAVVASGMFVAPRSAMAIPVSPVPALDTAVTDVQYRARGGGGRQSLSPGGQTHRAARRASRSPRHGRSPGSSDRCGARLPARPPCCSRARLPSGRPAGLSRVPPRLSAGRAARLLRQLVSSISLEPGRRHRGGRRDWLHRRCSCGLVLRQAAGARPVLVLHRPKPHARLLGCLPLLSNEA